MGDAVVVGQLAGHARAPDQLVAEAPVDHLVQLRELRQASLDAVVHARDELELGLAEVRGDARVRERRAEPWRMRRFGQGPIGTDAKALLLEAAQQPPEHGRRQRLDAPPDLLQWRPLLVRGSGGSVPPVVRHCRPVAGLLVHVVERPVVVEEGHLGLLRPRRPVRRACRPARPRNARALFQGSEALLAPRSPCRTSRRSSRPRAFRTGRCSGCACGRRGSAAARPRAARRAARPRKPRCAASGSRRRRR